MGGIILFCLAIISVVSCVGRLCRIRHQIIQQGCFITIVMADNSLGIAQLQVDPNGLKAQMANGLNVLLARVDLSLMPS